MYNQSIDVSYKRLFLPPNFVYFFVRWSDVVHIGANRRISLFVLCVCVGGGGGGGKALLRTTAISESYMKKVHILSDDANFLIVLVFVKKRILIKTGVIYHLTIIPYSNSTKTFLTVRPMKLTLAVCPMKSLLPRSLPA